MKLKYLQVLFLFIVFKTFSQENKNVLFTIDDDSYSSQEFLNTYQKNSKLNVESRNDIESYLNLFIAYKLKVKEAKSMGLDTLQSYKNELKKYKNNLVLPYLKDKEITKKLIEEAYARLKKEVSVSHILIFLKPNAPDKDTLAIYNSLNEARNLIINGEDFAEVAKRYSKDPSVQQNGGSVGYFTALQMVYPFENVAFTTPVNGVSMPFRTKFGYHILKVNAIRDSKGEVEVAHIMFKNNTKSSKKQIDSVYNLLFNKAANFADLAKKVSEDKASAIKGGKLKKFGAGQMIESFNDVAFSLKENGDISKPFKSKFGWHIVKLIKKYPIESFEELKAKLTQDVEKDERSNLIGKSVLKKLFKQYNVTVNEQALHQFNVENWKENPANFKQVLLSINGENIFQNKFITYLKTVNNTPVKEAFTGFKEKEVLDYFKENIEYTNAEFAIVYNEFKEGLLLFDLLEKQVWEKAKDSTGLLNYFNVNKAEKYNKKDFKDIKGTVISDYQNHLEIMLVKQLKEKYKVRVNKSEKRNVKKVNL
tara:strand:- start:15109 stop:16713 length:1605 start_codon:yes stop_codon:yes gene_type:complete